MDSDKKNSLVNKISQAKNLTGKILSNIPGQTKSAALNVREQVIEKKALWDKERQVKEEERIASKKKEEAKESGLYEEDGVLIVSSTDGMCKWLASMESEASPSALQCLKTQMDVISTINFPNAIGMATDTIIDSLYKAIRSAADEGEISRIRDSYATMLQNLLFFTEAKLYYAIEKRKEESIAMLGRAGDMLADSVMKVALLAIPTGTVVKTTKNTTARVIQTTASKVGINNIFNVDNNEKKFFSALLGWVNDKKKIVEELEQYNNTLEKMFESFDRYSRLIGPSILIHGMLSKYRTQLVNAYKGKLFKPYSDGIKVKLANSVMSEFAKSLEKNSFSILNPIGSALKITAGALKEIPSRQTAPITSLDAFFVRFEQTESEIESCQQEIKGLQLERTSLCEEKTKVGVFKRAIKEDISRQIEVIDQRITDAFQREARCREMLIAMKNALPEAPGLKKKVDEYERNLIRIELKFALDV